MNLYSVMRFGNDIEGADGADTEFIVLSDSVEGAADIVDSELDKMPHEKVKPFCHAISLIAKSFSETTDTCILHGPEISNKSKFAVGIPEENIWRRCEETGLGDWFPFDEF
ncbi:MAG: hypothetical protein K6L76_02905 [Agarilytica sp.]